MTSRGIRCVSSSASGASTASVRRRTSTSTTSIPTATSRRPSSYSSVYKAKINDIALIVGKENNILDPNEDEILERAGVETQKTIGELEVEEIEQSLRKSREVDDYNELDDTSTNPLLRNAGSNEDEAFERYLLKQELNIDYTLDMDDFEYAEEYFDDLPATGTSITRTSLDLTAAPPRRVCARTYVVRRWR